MSTTPFGSGSLNGKTILITGAAGFLGSFFCEQLNGFGVNVIALDKKERDFIELGKRMTRPELYHSLILDLSESYDLEDKFSKCLQIFPNIHGLVNCAAYNQVIHEENELVTLENFPIIEWEKTMAVNVLAPMILIRVLARMADTNSTLSVVNIASIFAHVAPDQRIYLDSKLNSNVAYGPSKAALVQLTKYLAAYFQGRNIRVNSISPGGIRRNQKADFIERYSLKTIRGRMGEPSDLLGSLVYLMSDMSDWVTGTDLIVDGGYSVW